MLKYVGDEKKAEWGKYWITRGFDSKELESCDLVTGAHFTSSCHGYCSHSQAWSKCSRRQLASTVLVMK